ncbi:MAG TPA: hypothetical protein VJ324_07030 [Candidatus Acidoferrum sp.]|nr:hypothetical protein [Candidatus Acidoferrum sp.]
MQAPEEPDSGLKPTKTFCVLVGGHAGGAGVYVAGHATDGDACSGTCVRIKQINVLRAEIGCH